MKPNSTNVAIKWSVFYLLTSIILTYLYQFLNVDPTSAVKYIGFIALFAFLFLSQKEFKEQLGGYISYGDAFVNGLWYSLFSGLMLAIFSYLYFAILSPAALDKMLAVTQAQMEAKGTATPEQIATSMDFMKKFGIYFFTIGSGIGIIFFGIIGALITAAILKKDRSPLDIAENSPIN